MVTNFATSKLLSCLRRNIDVATACNSSPLRGGVLPGLPGRAWGPGRAARVERGLGLPVVPDLCPGFGLLGGKGGALTSVCGTPERFLAPRPFRLRHQAPVIEA